MRTISFERKDGTTGIMWEAHWLRIMRSLAEATTDIPLISTVDRSNPKDSGTSEPHIQRKVVMPQTKTTVSKAKIKAAVKEVFRTGDGSIIPPSYIKDKRANIQRRRDYMKKYMEERRKK